MVNLAMISAKTREIRMPVWGFNPKDYYRLTDGWCEGWRFRFLFAKSFVAPCLFDVRLSQRDLNPRSTRFFPSPTFAFIVTVFPSVLSLSATQHSSCQCLDLLQSPTPPCTWHPQAALPAHHHEDEHPHQQHPRHSHGHTINDEWLGGRGRHSSRLPYCSTLYIVY